MDNLNNDVDTLFDSIVNYAIETKSISITALQKFFGIEQEQATKIIHDMECLGIITVEDSLGNHEIIINDKNDRDYPNEVKQIGKKTIIYQPYYSYGFTGKPKLIIDTHHDIKKYLSFNPMGSITEILTAVYLSLGWRRETVIEFHVDDDNSTLNLWVDLPEIEDTPVADKNGVKSAESYFYDYCRHIHSIVVRIISASFLCCSPINKIILVAYSQLFNPETEDDESNYLINLNISRDQFEKLDIQTIASADPILYLSALDAVTNIGKNYKMNVIDLKW